MKTFTLKYLNSHFFLGLSKFSYKSAWVPAFRCKSSPNKQSINFISPLEKMAESQMRLQGCGLSTSNEIHECHQGKYKDVFVIRQHFYNSNSILIFIVTALLFLNSNNIYAQDTTLFFKRNVGDSTNPKMNMDAIYNRPFLNVGKLPLAIGGYIEANTQYDATNGVDDGLSFQMRRMTLFFSSTIAKKIKFLSEIEFENGAKEINVETAVMDIEFHPLLNLRGGILLNPIGAFNQNHDGPRWDFIDRPIATTEIIPSTLSNVGFGFHGKYFYKKWTLGYEAYVTNGFDDKLIVNEDNHTSFAASKENNIDKFSKSNSGLPMFTGKIAIRNRTYGELGISYLTGVYNQWKTAGLIIDEKRTASIVALDFNTSFLKNKINVTGELAKTFIQLPNNYVQTYGSQQFGMYCDVVATIVNKKIFDWENAKINVGLRFDYADYNQDNFRQTNQKIYDETWAITPSIAFRPSGTTVLRLNYKYQETKDIVGNSPSKTGSIQFGISSYF
jgi:hypothetical protein